MIDVVSEFLEQEKRLLQYLREMGKDNFIPN